MKEKKNLLHEGLVEVITLLIKTRNKIYKIGEDEELVNMWKEKLIRYAEDLNGINTGICDILGQTVSDRIEKKYAESLDSD